MTSFDYFDRKDLDAMTVAERYHTVQLMLIAMRVNHTLPLDVAYEMARNVILERR